MKNEKIDKIISLILKVIPLALSVAVVALTVLGQITPESGVVLLALGMFCGTLERMRQ